MFQFLDFWVSRFKGRRKRRDKDVDVDRRDDTEGASNPTSSAESAAAVGQIDIDIPPAHAHAHAETQTHAHPQSAPQVPVFKPRVPRIDIDNDIGDDHERAIVVSVSEGARNDYDHNGWIRRGSWPATEDLQAPRMWCQPTSTTATTTTTTTTTMEAGAGGKGDMRGNNCNTTSTGIDIQNANRPPAPGGDAGVHVAQVCSRLPLQDERSEREREIELEARRLAEFVFV